MPAPVPMLQDQPDEDRVAALEEAVKGELDTLAEEIRCQRLPLKTNLETKLGNCLTDHKSLLSAHEDRRKRLFAVEESVKQGLGSLDGQFERRQTLSRWFTPNRLLWTSPANVTHGSSPAKKRTNVCKGFM